MLIVKSKLSQAIKEDTLSIRNSLPILGAKSDAIKSGVDALQNETHANAAAIATAESLKKHAAMLTWLSQSDYSVQQRGIISQRQEGTGQWFLDSPQFKQWLDGPDMTLFCPGIPGAGKTMLAAITNDYLRRHRASSSVEVAFLFCNYKRQAEQTLEIMLPALLKQLVQPQPGIAAPVMELFEAFQKHNTIPSISQIQEALKTVIMSYDTVFLVVDALDEYSTKDRDPGQLIDTLRKLQADTSRLRLLFTSRFISDISQRLQPCLTLEIRAREEDVTAFVAGQMSRLPPCIRRDKDLENQVMATIILAVEGM